MRGVPIHRLIRTTWTTRVLSWSRLNARSVRALRAAYKGPQNQVQPQRLVLQLAALPLRRRLHRLHLHRLLLQRAAHQGQRRRHNRQRPAACAVLTGESESERGAWG